MKLILLFIIVAVLLAIAVEDFRSRTVHAFWFPVLFIAGGFYSIQYICFDEVLGYTLINLGFLVVQGILLVTYFILKHRQWVNITHMYLGWGDVLFVLAVLPLFNSFMFILFYLSSLLLTILFVIISKMVGKQMVFIPLAGIQAIYLIGFVAYHQFVHSILFSEVFLPLVI